MDLVEIDVVGPEPRQGGVDLFEDGLARQALTARAVMHPAVHLGGQHDVLAAGVTLDGAADELLGGPVLIDVGGVPEGDSEVHGLPEEGLGRVVVEGPQVRGGCGWVAVTHAAEREATHA